MTAGVFASSLRDTRLDVTGALELARTHGCSACMFGSAFELSPKLDPAELADRRAQAADYGIALHVAFPQIHPHRFGQDRDVLAAGDGDVLLGARRLLEASATLDGRDLTVIIGRIEDRFDPVVPWADQLATAGALLDRMAPMLRDTGLRFALKTHEEITSFEVVRLAERLGPDVAGIAFDPVNVLVNLEDPAAAAARVAGWTTQVMLEDAELDLAGDRARRLLCPLGEGVVDWQAVAGSLAALAPAPPHYWIELHRGQFSVYPYDARWLAHHPDLDVAEYAATLRLMLDSTDRITPSRRAGLEATQARPATRLAGAVTFSQIFSQEDRS
jgi:sugar phosphate isomerase/epimerase